MFKGKLQFWYDTSVLLLYMGVGVLLGTVAVVAKSLEHALAIGGIVVMTGALVHAVCLLVNRRKENQHGERPEK